MAKPVFATNDVPSAAQFNDWFVNVGFVSKTTSEDRTSTIALADDTVLFLPIVAGAKYRWEMMINYDAPTTVGILIGFSMPVGTSIIYTASGPSTGGTGSYAEDQMAAFESASAPGFGAQGVGTRSGILLTGMMTTGGTAGDFKFRWAQRVSNATRTRIFGLSYLDMRRVD